MKQVYHNAHYRSTNFRDASLSFKSRQQHCHPPIYVQFTLQQSNKYTIMAITGQPSGATGWIRTSDLKDLQSFALGLSATVAQKSLGCSTGIDPVLPLSQSRVQATTLKTPLINLFAVTQCPSQALSLTTSPFRPATRIRYSNKCLGRLATHIWYPCAHTNKTVMQVATQHDLADLLLQCFVAF